MSLTDRERQILALLADGHDRPTIGRKLALTEHTVRTHTQNLYRKLHAHTAAQAVSAGYRHGYLTVDAHLDTDVAVLRSLRTLGYRLALVPIREDA